MKAKTPFVTSNTRLTRSIGRLLFWLVIFQFVFALLFFGICVNWSIPLWMSYSAVRAVHFFIGFMLIPLVLLKLMTTSWKAGSYYAGRKIYKKEGPPRWYNRLLSPVMGILFLITLWSGVAMWGSIEYLFPIPYIYHDYSVVQWHLWSATFLVGLVVFHMIAHFRETFRNKRRRQKEDQANRESTGVVVARRALLGTFAAGSIALALSAAEWPWPSLSWLNRNHDGPGPLEYPVITYFGSGTKVDANKWRLNVIGSVANPLALSYSDILAMPSKEVKLPLQCVQGWRIERRWRGVPLKDLYQRAQASKGFKSIYVHSASGYHFMNHAYQHLQDDALLVTHVDGVPLSDDHGFPARILLPGLPGQNNPKWVDLLEVRMDAADKYYGPNFYSEWGPTGELTDPTKAYLAPGSAGLDQ